VLQPLQIYPVAGSQMRCGTIAGVLSALVCLGDAGAWLCANVPAPARRFTRQGIAALVLVITGLAVRRDFTTERAAFGMATPLGLPGAERMRMSPVVADAVRDLVKHLRATCPQFGVVPGAGSLYFWAGQAPPTLDVLPHEMPLVSDERLAVIETALEGPAASCVVRYGALYPPLTPDPRVETWLAARYRPERTFGDYTVYVRQPSLHSGRAPVTGAAPQPAHGPP
jgi:hypothetical protein